AWVRRGAHPDLGGERGDAQQRPWRRGLWRRRRRIRRRRGRLWRRRRVRWMVIKLTTEAHDRIAAAIAAAGTRSSGDIFWVLARRVPSYHDVSLAWAAAAALVLPLGLIPLGFDPGWIPGMADSWEAAHLASRDISA